MSVLIHKCFLCHSSELQKVAEINVRPLVENNYGIPPDKYYREVHQCLACNVFNSFHDLLTDSFYQGFYNNSITTDSFRRRFEKIIGLSEKSSDNKARVKRIANYLSENFQEKKSVLDIGSGTCVFLYEMKNHNFYTACIDPDPQAIKHAKEVVQVDEEHCGSVFDFKSGVKFDLITFNKVLEHIENPVENAKKALEFLKEDGLLYIELPEGDRIAQEGQIAQRAEFVMEHLTVYNEKSMQKLADLCGCKINEMGVITDPSGKYTIYAFMQKIK